VPFKVEDSIGTVVAADSVARGEVVGLMADVDAWVRRVIGQRLPDVAHPICPFISPALERGGIYYVPVTRCRRAEDVVAAVSALVDQFVALPPRGGHGTQLKTLVAVFVDIDDKDAASVVIAAHRELKTRCVERGLMIGEFAPGYELAWTRNPAVNVGDAPAPVLALRYMLPSDRRFLGADDRWMAAWASRYGADRVPLFQPCSIHELAAIGRVAHEMPVEAGRVLCYEGDVGDAMFLILEGEAEVQRGGQPLASLGPGAYFGELALLTERRRNATVIATTLGTVLVLGRREFRTVIDSFPPLAHKLLVGLAERLSQADTTSLHD
jgi:uncharacterized protein DUF6875/cyclic nucleotide-binding protein